MKNKNNQNLVAIVGRPNVGKSTLFNRLIGKRQAIETQEAGTTRDWLVGECKWRNKTFTIADMAGMYGKEIGDLGKAIQDSINKLIDEAKVILFLVDAKEGLMELDKKIAEDLRKIKKPVYLVINKVSNQEMETQAEAEFSKLGFEKVFMIAAISGRNTDQLLNELIKNFPQKLTTEKQEFINVAILGRPNVGKSLLFNNLIGETRALVSEVPGTTRDTVDSIVRIHDQVYRFIDTAGIRKRGARSKKLIEKISFLRTEKIVENSDIVILLIDSVEGTTKQDLHILELVDRYSTGLLILLNKKDLIDQEKLKKELQIFREKAPFVNWAEILTISAKTKENLAKIPKILSKIVESRNKKYSLKELEKILQDILKKRPVPQKPNFKEIKILKIIQEATNPPNFAVFSNFPEKLHFSYKRYIKRELMSALKFFSTAIKIWFIRLR